jgi:hypothetical protein
MRTLVLQGRKLFFNFACSEITPHDRLYLLGGSGPLGPGKSGCPSVLTNYLKTRTLGYDRR